jgi:hypothetical protein
MGSRMQDMMASWCDGVKIELGLGGLALYNFPSFIHTTMNAGYG